MLSAARLYPAQHRWRKTETERSSIVTSRVLAKNGILCKYLWYDSISTRWKQQQQIEEKKSLRKNIKTWEKSFCSRNSSEILWQSLMSEFHGYKLFDATSSSSSSSSVHQTKQKKKKNTKQNKYLSKKTEWESIWYLFDWLHSIFDVFPPLFAIYFFWKLITSGINEAIIIQ